jgi:hypothetical protein
MMEKNIHRKALTVSIICLFLLMSVPVISSSEMPVMNDNLSSVICKRITFPCNDHEHFLSKPGRLVDNIKIRCYGIFELIDIFMMILGAPVPFINLEIISYNNISVTIDDHFTIIDTKNDRVLYDFDAGGLPWKLQPHWYFSTNLMTNKHWRAKNYIFGPFDLIYKLRIPEDNSSTTVLFHGFVFVFGAKIFNSAGEKLVNDTLKN